MAEMGKNSGEIENLLKRMFYRLTKKSPRVGQQGWVHLARYIHGPLKNVMPALNIDQCFEVSTHILI